MRTNSTVFNCNGLERLTITRQIGQASAATTSRVYGHMIKNADVRAAKIMEETFGRVRAD